MAVVDAQIVRGARYRPTFRRGYRGLAGLAERAARDLAARLDRIRTFTRKLSALILSPRP